MRERKRERETLCVKEELVRVKRILESERGSVGERNRDREREK